MNSIIWLGVIILLALVGVLGDFFIKLSGIKIPADWRLFSIGLIIYALTAFGWFFVMRQVKLSTLGVFYALGTVLFLTLVSTLYFKESLNPYEIIGIILAIISLVLLGRFA
ncbi:MAG: transporter [Candidatus Vogelbacteria bacterium]